ncbi:MAG: Sensor protein kinase WalK [Gammaproteobacteria bacterium]|nr:Sensor protein kinase WalK [Gammaproteobacteria bacterium]
MANQRIIDKLIGPIPALILSLVVVASLLMLIAAAQDVDASVESYLVLLGLNVLGIFVLLALIGGNLWRLRRQWRGKVLGSRLTLRMIGLFVLLVLIPLSVVYYVSTQFLSKGIDSWFDVRVDRAVNDALLLGKTSLETIKRDAVDDLSGAASRLIGVENELSLITLLDEVREDGDLAELLLLSHDGRIIASSQKVAGKLIPDRPNERVLSEVRGGGRYVNLEPLAGGVQQLRIAVPVLGTGISRPSRILHGLKLVPLRYSRLAESIENASARYRQMVFSRRPLKFSLILTLTVVTLAASMLAVWAAIYVSRRMLSPLRDLAEGTRAVAAGDYRKKLPVPSSDELGVLVESFNNMTRQIHRAQTSVKQHQQETERQRTYLEAILAHLSSGVLSFDYKNRLLTYNAAVTQILDYDFKLLRKQTAEEISGSVPKFEPLFRGIRDSIERDEAEWNAEVTIFADRGRQVLIVRGTRISSIKNSGSGYVVVFDDVTELIQAQRDAAWREVARRLAHEIKNPLTPIQLSAERIRAKYLNGVAPEDRDALDRATRTIAQQVESMKVMVNAFSNYAQPSEQKFESLALNQLIRDVAELFVSEAQPSLIHFDLEPGLPSITADPGRLRQVLNNLILNAKDATSDVEKPEIKIRTRYIEENKHCYVELTISDNGYGFTEEDQSRLFEPYVTTKDEKGTGLGLAVVKRIVEEHGGLVWLDSAVQAGGAVATITLPVGESAVNTDLKLRRAQQRFLSESTG